MAWSRWFARRSSRFAAGHDGGSEQAPFEVYVRAFGRNSGPAERFAARIAVWDAAGHPATAGLCISVYPLDFRYEPAVDEIVMPKRWNRLVLDWQASST